MRTIPAPDPTKKILLVENHHHVRAALRDWLSDIFTDYLFLEAESGEQAIILTGEHDPRLVLMDISLSGMSGLEAACIILHNCPIIKVVMLSIHDETRYRADAAAIGVSGFVSKATMSTVLIPTLMQAMSVADESQI